MARIGICSHVLAALLIAMTGFAHADNAEPITWAIGNRFRAFDYLAHGPSDAAPAAYVDHNRSGQRAAAWFAALAPDAEGEDGDSWLKQVISQGGSPFNDGDRGPWREADNAYDADFTKLPATMMLQVALNPNDPVTSRAKGMRCIWRFNNEVRGESLPCGQPAVLEDITTNGGTLGVSTEEGTQLATVVIPRPRLKIILGLGDSYSAGEGAPDVQAIWKKPRGAENPSDLKEVWDFDQFVEHGAQWWSSRCDRSFYSWETLVALREAARDPHAIVAFAHLACAGAEVVDGMLAPQRAAPGQFRDCKPVTKRRDRGAAVDTHCDVPDSQLTMAVKLLCDDSAVPLLRSDPLMIRLSAELGSSHIRYARDQVSRINELVGCKGNLKPVQAVLMSMGGNDVGFAGIIADIIYPSYNKTFHGAPIPFTKMLLEYGRKESSVVCFRGVPCPGVVSKYPWFEDRRLDLQTRYSALQQAFTSLLQVPANRVVIAQYPDPLEDARGALCGAPPFSNDNGPWWALKWIGIKAARASGVFQWVAIPYVNSLNFNVTLGEAEAVRSHVINALNDSVRNDTPGWAVADATRAFDRHGWCVGEWQTLSSPAAASEWDGLADQQRYIRTANDSALTQWPELVYIGKRIDEHQSRNDGISGTFHPNAQGYAAVADAVDRSLGQGGDVGLTPSAPVGEAVGAGRSDKGPSSR